MPRGCPSPTCGAIFHDKHEMLKHCLEKHAPEAKESQEHTGVYRLKNTGLGRQYYRSVERLFDPRKDTCKAFKISFPPICFATTTVLLLYFAAIKFRRCHACIHCQFPICGYCNNCKNKRPFLCTYRNCLNTFVAIKAKQRPTNNFKSNIFKREIESFLLLLRQLAKNYVLKYPGMSLDLEGIFQR